MLSQTDNVMTAMLLRPYTGVYLQQTTDYYSLNKVIRLQYKIN